MRAKVILLGRGPNRCGICNLRRAVVGWCDECRKSYDRSAARDRTILASVMWGARRARRFAKAAAK